MKNTVTRKLIYCALLAALTAVCAWLVIPIGPVPISLSTFAVMLCGLLLGWKYGVIAVAVYILLGLAGVPVFTGFRAASALLGPTGGYIIGYIAAAFIIGLLIEKLVPASSSERVKELLIYAVAMIAGLFVCYLLGTLWFMIITHTGAWAALVSCVFPFLPGDGLKIIAGALLVRRLRMLL